MQRKSKRTRRYKVLHSSGGSVSHDQEMEELETGEIWLFLNVVRGPNHRGPGSVLAKRQAGGMPVVCLPSRFGLTIEEIPEEWT